jgi:hypothetical protein
MSSFGTHRPNRHDTSTADTACPPRDAKQRLPRSGLACPRLVRWLAVLGFCLSVPLAATAQEATAGTAPGQPPVEYRAAVAILSLPADAEAETFAETLRDALVREFSAAGFREIVPLGPAPATGLQDQADQADQVLASAASSQTSARWTALIRCSVERRRLLWTVSVYDATDGALIAADSQASFAGLSALPFIDSSAALVAREAWNLRTRVVPGQPIGYRIRFVSANDGARVSFGSGASSRDAGTVQGGQLLAPFVAFRDGDPIVVSVDKDGYWGRTIVFNLSPEDEVVALPVLMPQTRHSLGLGLSTARLLGLSADYRYHLAPDAFFLRASDSLWLQYAFLPGSVPVIHNETRLGVGAYLFMPRHSRFRLAVGTGVSGIMTLALPQAFEDRFYFDAVLDALLISLEWHTPSLGFFLEQRLSYSLGLESGLLRRAWLEPNAGPLLMTLGVMKRW